MGGGRGAHDREVGLKKKNVAGVIFNRKFIVITAVWK